MGIEQDMDALAERTLQLAIVAQRLDERSEDAVRATERAAQEASASAAHLANLGERVARDAVLTLSRDAAIHLEHAAARAFAQAQSALDMHATRLRELDASVQATCTALARSHRRWWLAAPTMLVVACGFAILGTGAWVAKSRAEVATLRRDAAVLDALARSDVALCGDALCARVERNVGRGGYQRVMPR